MKKGKFRKFGLTIHPKGGEQVNWKQLTKDEISAKLEQLEYPTPLKVARVLSETRIFKEAKKNSATGKVSEYFSEVEDFGGQLELGDRNGTPHYQCWISLTSKQTATKVLGYYSREFYKKSKSNAISVIVLTEDISEYQEYCRKENCAELPGKYQHILINETISEFDKYLEDNPEAKKYFKILMDIKST